MHRVVVNNCPLYLSTQFNSCDSMHKDSRKLVSKLSCDPKRGKAKEYKKYPFPLCKALVKAGIVSRFFCDSSHKYSAIFHKLLK